MQGYYTTYSPVVGPIREAESALPEREQQRQPPIVERLTSQFSKLPDSELIRALKGRHHHGRQGYSIHALWHSYLVSYLRGIPSAAALVRELHDNPYLALACGFKNPWVVPSEATYSRFVSKLAAHQDQVEECVAALVARNKEANPNFGTTVAVDSTDIRAWSNGLKKTDPDARTGAKRKESRRYWWHGYKLHLAVDAETELPLWGVVTPANAYDGHHLPTVLTEAKERFEWFKPKYILGDKGYDSRACFDFVREKLSATPVIDVRESKKKAQADERPCEAIPAITPDGVRYRCKRMPYSPFCPKFDKCPMLPIFVDSPMNKTTMPRYFEKGTDVPFGSKAWKTVYNKRVSVERVFSRLKGQRRLDDLKHRGLGKVNVHVLLSILAYSLATTMAQRPVR